MRKLGFLLPLLLAGCVTDGGGAKTAYPPEPPAAKPLAGMQYLYGSGEAAAVSRQAWAALTNYVAGTLGG